MIYENKIFISIPDFPGYYICKDTSDILSTNKKEPYIMAQSINSTTSNSTYYMVRCVDHKKITRKLYVHRLMAELFILNPDNKKQVNHIDGNKHNNSVANLEWVSHQENAIHAYATGLCPTVAVNQYTLSGDLVASYRSIKEAETVTGVCNPNITKVIKGIRRTAGGFIWKLT